MKTNFVTKSDYSIVRWLFVLLLRCLPNFTAIHREVCSLTVNVSNSDRGKKWKNAGQICHQMIPLQTSLQAD